MRRELKDISEEEILHFLGYGDAVPDEQTLHALREMKTLVMHLVSRVLCIAYLSYTIISS